MKTKVKKTLNSLTGKLILSIGALMIIGGAVFWYFLIYYEERELLRNSEKYGYSFANVVRKSIHYGMLAFQPNLIQHTVETIGSANDVIRVRVFDCSGRIAYSSNKDEKGMVLDRAKSFCMNQFPRRAEIKEASSYSGKKDKNGVKALNMLTPIYNEPACYTSSCHVHRRGDSILGVIESDISLSFMGKTIKEHKIAMAVFFLGFIAVVSVVLCKILWNTVSVPLSILAKGMEEVAAGNLNYTVEIDTKDEIGELARSFNAMTTDISKAKGKIVEWASTLEKNVNEKTEEIRKAQAQLIQSEKLSSLGRMAAGVAHEINSPLTGIVTFSHLLLNKFPEGSEEKKDIKIIIEQANRCSTIIKGLLGFARAASADKSPLSINDIVKNSVNMVSHKADFFNIQIVMTLDESLPSVMASASQIHQVFLNMIINAADAMEGVGTLAITTRKIMQADRPFAEIEFTDTGHGISEENLSKIFEPFFTTKPVGKGTGLGLAVSHGIISDHGGNIALESAMGAGTRFFIRLPIYEGKK